MDEFVQWLLEQIAEDERIARDAAANTLLLSLPSVPFGSPLTGHEIDNWLSNRLLAECETKRQIIELCAPRLLDVSPLTRPGSEFIPGAAAPWAEPVLRHYGALYAQLGRPGYREEWRP